MRSLRTLLSEIMVFRKPLAFFYKDFLNEASYKFAFFTQFIGIFLSVLSFFFLSKLFGNTISPHLQSYGGDYFSFVLIGIALTGYLQVSLRSFSSNIRNSQITGTLEALLLTQTSIPTIILSSSIYSFLLTSFRIFIYLLLGVILSRFDITHSNLIGALLILCLTIICFSSIGIMSASFIMILKKGDPLSFIFTNLSWFLGGVYYPITILPDWLQKISYVLPITYALEGIRMALLKGMSTRELFPYVLPLALFAAVLLPFSIGMFSFAVKKAKFTGSLMQY